MTDEELEEGMTPEQLIVYRTLTTSPKHGDETYPSLTDILLSYLVNVQGFTPEVAAEEALAYSELLLNEVTGDKDGGNNTVQ